MCRTESPQPGSVSSGVVSSFVSSVSSTFTWAADSIGAEYDAVTTTLQVKHADLQPGIRDDFTGALCIYQACSPRRRVSRATPSWKRRAARGVCDRSMLMAWRKWRIGSLQSGPKREPPGISLRARKALLKGICCITRNNFLADRRSANVTLRTSRPSDCAEHAPGRR